MMISSIGRKKPNITDSKDDSLPTPGMFWNSLTSIQKFAIKLFKISTTKQLDISSTNHVIIMDSVPTLPFDLITEILSRLPVKFLLKFQCVSKSWNSLISHDPNFAKKHLTKSTTHSLNSLGFTFPGILTMYPPDFFFNTFVFTNVKQHEHPSQECNRCLRAKKVEIVGSCNGILCLAYKEFIQLWNPTIGKLKELPVLRNPHHLNIAYGFGYDSVTDHYKVVVVLWDHCGDEKTQVKVNTLGTKLWKNIEEEFPFGSIPDQKSGKCVSGTINWLASSRRWPRPSPRFIVSLDLRNESYQKVLLPDNVEVNDNSLTLDVSSDCLCMISGHDVWLMKEYGKKESWNKLFTISYTHNPRLSYSFTKVVYIFEDGQVLLQIKMAFVRPQLMIYDPRIATFKFVTFQKSFYGSRFFDLDVSKYGGLVVSIESLISPCS
ncbi:F-box/kelch-repeat protein At3g23880-like [Vicia villosa]|uniref:F-box/kelch-repeat protein At3g23880-like n=1 Tax=Vicia villosa TaxID=3911 RepID=UPI00273C625D|nr:F-box/kelch-repeat protein At3g23880-like [Vicia villosa]